MSRDKKLVKVEIIREDVNKVHYIGEIMEVEPELADLMVKEKVGVIIEEKAKNETCPKQSSGVDEIRKFIGDLRHAVKLAAKAAGKTEEEAQKLQWDFFNLRKEERDPAKLCELAVQFCKEKGLPEPSLPTIKVETKNKRRKSESDEPFTYAPGGETENAIYEIVYDPKTKHSRFAKYDKNPGMVEIVEEFRDDLGNLIKPYSSTEFEELLKNGIILPDGVEDYGTMGELQREIQSFIHKWADVDERFEKFASYYVLLTWVYDKANSLVYLRLKGPHGMGKSRFLKTVGQICFRAMPGGGAVGAAPIFRKIDRWHGTLLMDEADFKQSDESIDIIKIINCGFEKGIPVERCDQNDATKLRFFDVFGPKILCTRKEWSDSATESRCLTHNMYMTTRKDIKDSLTLDFFEDQARLRRKLLMFRLRKLLTIDFDKALDIDLGPIEPRLRQTNRAFAALFLDDENLQADFKQFLMEYAKELSEQMAESMEGMVINALVSLGLPGENEDKENFIPPTVSANDIYQYLQNENMLSQRSKTSARSIGKILRSLGFKSGVRKVDNKAKRCLVFEQAHLESILPRYISDAEKLQSYVCYNATRRRGGDVTGQPEAQQTTLNSTKSHDPPPPSSNVTNVTCNFTVHEKRLHEKGADVTCNRPETAPQEAIQEEFISDGAPGEIHQKCVYCELTPCIGYNKRGQPICQYCLENLNKHES